MTSDPTESTGARSRSAARARPAWLLTAAAVVGALSILLFLASLLFGVRVYAFASGSMEPTIPRGSLGLTLERSVDLVEPGDVVTVVRADQLPVTHRIVDIERGDAGAPATLTLQGDANPDPDATLYSATAVQVLVGSVPGLGYVVGAALGQPWLIGTLTILLAAGVTWYWWPGSGRRRAGAPPA
ncbi:signal peptidase I [Plantibacter sp. YIM 135249]|uniref:signal peptidase I n=1 Tax=Plantibacter sp. YIM 135249 TaxID=3423918 RepID=UPI003D3440D2